MNVIQVGLSTLVMFGGMLLARPATADHLRHAENLGEKLHHQTVDYVRWLRYHLPECEFGVQLRQDAIAVLQGVNELQSALLFSGSSSGEVRRLRTQLHALHVCVEEAHRRIEEYEAQLRHSDRFGHSWRQHGRHGIQFQVGRAVTIHVPENVPAHDRAAQHRLRDALHALAVRLHTVHRTIDQLDEALWAAAGR